MLREPPPGPTPGTGLTADEEARAIDVALEDARLQGLLAGKNYVVAPKDDRGRRKIGLWTTEEGKKLGVSLVIQFDKPYFVDADLPYDDWKDRNFATYESKTRHHSAMVRQLVISIDLYIDPKGGGRVSKIIPM